jgi:hypothetical protein
MQQFYGTKLIAAEPMTRAQYNILRGWTLPANENGDDAGYLVEYLDGGKPNLEGFAGYVSWSPAEQFEKAYQPTDAMSFGHAVEALKAGKKVARAGWNGKGMFLVFVPATLNAMLKDGTPYADALFDSKSGEPRHTVSINAHIDMFTATGQFQPGWLASQTDILADDWQIVD